MKFLQRMLSHGLLIAIVVVAGLAYWYRAELFPEQFGSAEPRTVAGKPVTGVGDDKEATTVNAADAGSKTTAETPDQPDAEEVSAEEAASPAPQATELPPMSEADSETAQPPASSPAESPLSWESDETSTSASSEETPQFRPLETEREAPPPLPAETESHVAQTTSPSTLSTAPAETGDADAQQGLAAAREAFWRNDIESAERHYRTVIEQQPDNPDVYGELGNLHYQQGQWQQAAEAYYQAALRLLDRGDRMPAQHLLRILRSLDPERARELESRMSGTMSSG